MTCILRLTYLCALAAIAPLCAFCSATVYTNQAAWDAAVQAAGYNLVSVNFANPSAWMTSSYSVGTESYNGVTSNQTSDGMSVTIDDAAFESLVGFVSIQNNSLVDSEQATKPERDTSFSFGNTIYAFGGDYSLSCGPGPFDLCASSTFFFSTGSSVDTAGPDSSGFWGIVVSPDAGAQQFVQGIATCPANAPQCYFDYSLSNFAVAVATPEPSYVGLLTLLGTAAWVTGRRRLKASE